MEAPKQKLAPIFTRRKTCRACDSNGLTSVIDMGLHYLPRYSDGPDESIPQAPLHLLQCLSCGLLQLAHTTDPDLLYREFWYRSSVNRTMCLALDDLVQSALPYAKEGTWLDIGANDGYLLSRVPETFTKIACEPAVNFEAQLQEHANIVIPTYFSAKNVKERFDAKVDVITSAACFYDVDDPSKFVRDISKLLSKDGVWINQLNDSPTMLRMNAFDAICHEHLCYYDVPTLKRLYAQHGLKITEISYNDVNGGSVRIFASKSLDEMSLAGVPETSPDQARKFAERTRRWKDQLRDILESKAFQQEPVWGYGASTKGSTLLQYLDMDKSFLAVADRNSLKWGKCMAGSWLPIVSEAELRKAKPRYALVMPWAFRSEFIAREQSLRDAGTTMIFPLPNLEFCL